MLEQTKKIDSIFNYDVRIGSFLARIRNYIKKLKGLHFPNDTNEQIWFCFMKHF